MNRSAILIFSCLIAALALSGCDRYLNTPQCGEKSSAEAFPNNMVMDDKGSVLDTDTGLRWYRCSAGMRFANGQCIGDAIKLSQQDATEYAKEFSARANQDWRLPTAGEMQTITLSGCLNPILHPQIFPGVLIDNYWTSSINTGMPSLGCTYYTFNGNFICRELRSQPRPFLLVLDKP